MISGVINPTNENSIKKLWRVYHAVCLGLIPSIFLIWILTPSVTRNLSSKSQLILRLLSVSYGIAGSSLVLYSAIELTQLKPKIDALRNRETADFKLSLAADLWLAKSTNAAIAESVLIGRKEELGFPVFSEPGTPETLMENEFPEVPGGSESPGKLELQGSGKLGNSGNFTQDNIKNHPQLDEVSEALESEIPDSKIVKEILGCKGRSYQDGVKILGLIKNYLEECNDD